MNGRKRKLNSEESKHSSSLNLEIENKQHFSKKIKYTNEINQDIRWIFNDDTEKTIENMEFEEFVQNEKFPENVVSQF